MEEVFRLSQKQLDRYHVIQEVLEGRMRQVDAAALLGIGDRQVRRVCSLVELKGARALIHGLTGRDSNNPSDLDKLELVLNAVHLVRWDGFGPKFASEKIAEYFGVTVSKETVRKLMIQVELYQPKRRGRRHRAWREPRPMLGMLVQLDGSDHDWFEGRRPRCVLLVFIDDATSRILHAEFVEVEDTWWLMKATRNYLRRNGRPLSLYVDRASIYTVNMPGSVEAPGTVEDQLRGAPPLTQFTRAMEELGISVQLAYSPQAKGRVERTFDTHQDRLVKELRLRGISTIEQANRFLLEHYIDDHNHRCARGAAVQGDGHRPLTPGQDLRAILAVKNERVVQRDTTVQCGGRVFQIDDPVAPKATVTIEDRIDGTTRIVCRGRSLRFRRIAKRPDRPMSHESLGLEATKVIHRRPQQKVDPFFRDAFNLRSSSTPLNPPASQGLS